MKDQHRTLFKKSSNSRGYVMCVISPEFIEEFTSMGFVDHIDKLEKKSTKPKKAK